ncbi:hypothetical protein ABZ570_33330 [Micromonospora sp. NPDC007271]|uniref:hypothetical protein n=1 Tax=Micromonospora sp. NPDC007271 TaxID=3154587 RepID=UPI0034034091
MPAKRSPKKSPRPVPSPLAVTPPDLAALLTASMRAAPSAFPEAVPEPSPTGSRAELAPAPEAGPPTGRDARFAGHARRAAQPRRYAFRRS